MILSRGHAWHLRFALGAVLALGGTGSSAVNWLIPGYVWATYVSPLRARRLTLPASLLCWDSPWRVRLQYRDGVQPKPEPLDILTGKGEKVLDKRVFRLLPWPVTLIGACHEGKHNVMTASWVSQVSFRPPLVMVSIAPERYTYGLIEKSGEFVVSILAEDQAEIANFCGTHSGRDVDKVSALGIRTRPGKAVKVPILEDCLANIECRVAATYPAGDHVLFVGEVVGGSVTCPDAFPLLMLDWKPGKFNPIAEK